MLKNCYRIIRKLLVKCEHYDLTQDLFTRYELIDIRISSCTVHIIIGTF